MNCTHAAERLPDLVAGDLSPADRADLEAHLASCPACQRERDSLEQVCRLLSAAAAPSVQVDLTALHRAAADEERRRARRWKRRAIVAALALAAGLLIALFVNLEVKIGDGQLVVRWGKPSDPTVIREVVRIEQERDPANEERLRVLQELVQALATDAQMREAGTDLEIARLRRQLQELRMLAVQQWEGLHRDVSALYTDRFVKKGTMP